MNFLVQTVYAAENLTSSSFDSLFGKIINNIVNPGITLFLGLAVVFFVWGLFEFISNAAQTEKRDQGYQHMLWGIIGIFIMIAAKGIINIILATVGA